MHVTELKNLIELRHRKRLSQADVANAIGANVQTVSDIERWRRRGNRLAFSMELFEKYKAYLTGTQAPTQAQTKAEPYIKLYALAATDLFGADFTLPPLSVVQLPTKEIVAIKAVNSGVYSGVDSGAILLFKVPTATPAPDELVLAGAGQEWRIDRFEAVKDKRLVKFVHIGTLKGDHL